jgi:ArsR family transcriptional regulator
MDLPPMRYPDQDVDAALLLKALAHPARLAMVRALADGGGCCCGDIVRRLPLAQSTVSQHLKILKLAGLIEGTVEGPRAAYALADGRVAETVGVLRTLADRLEAEGDCCAGAPGDEIACASRTTG